MTNIQVPDDLNFKPETTTPFGIGPCPDCGGIRWLHLNHVCSPSYKELAAEVEMLRKKLKG